MFNKLLPFTHCYLSLFDREKGGGGELEEEVLDIMGEDDEDEGEEEDIEEVDDTEAESETEEEDETGIEDESEEDVEEEEEEFQAQTVKADKKGNLIDPKTGKIVAPFGPARRFYEKMVDGMKAIHGLQQQAKRDQILKNRAGQVIQQFQKKVAELEKGNSTSQPLGLSPDETHEFLNLAAKFKSNSEGALGAIRYLLTKAVQKGYDIKSLGASPGAATDVSVFANDIKKSIEERLKPLEDVFAQRGENNEAKQRFLREREDFILTSDVPDQLMPVIDKLMIENTDFRQLGWQGTWLAVQNHLLRNRGRYSKERASPDGKRRSRPGGRSQPSVVGRKDQVDNSPADVNATFKEIVRSTVKDLGGVDI